MPFASEQRVKAYRSMCTIRQVEEGVHKAFATGQILGVAHPVVHPFASMHRGHGHSIEEGGES
jgi:pyruvate dehydrogenase E1 component alpha subunit